MISDLDNPAAENPDQSSLRFMVCNYGATGEGHTVSILICTMHVQSSEWEHRPKVDLGTRDQPAKYSPGKLNCTPRDVLTRQFSDVFGSYLTIGIEFLDWETMKEDYAAYLPSALAERVERRDCHLKFQTQVHVNFS